jgi:hypothetical protein
LAIVGESKLSADIAADVCEVTVDDPKFFNQMENNSLRTVRVGNELIQYASVAGNVLKDCKRGAFGTKVEAHKKGARIVKLMDHGYNVFLTNAQLSIEVAKNIAKLFNETGLRQLSFDGLEGNWSTGMGQYGRTLFTDTWFDNLSPALKGQVINDASNPGAYFWHIYTRMNWGEPWYAGFRESQTQYRLANQKYFRRNLMPGMLGWFSMNAETSLEDAEWLLARAAGFDAGFCLCTGPEVIKANGDGEQILLAIREWERARLSGAFAEEQKLRLQKIENEFTLRSVGDKAWELVPVASTKHRLPVTGSLQVSLSNPYETQPLQFIVQVPAGTVMENPTFSVGGASMEVKGAFAGPCALRYSGGGEISVCDGHWKEQRRVSVVAPLVVATGAQQISVSGKVTGEKPAEIKVEFRLVGKAEPVRGR